MEERTCPNCNKPIRPGDESCHYCGFVFPFSTSIFPPGTLLHGRYEIQQLIHSGGMGYIYLATDKNLFDRTCIVKQVREQIKSKEHQEKLEEEALRMSRLNHPNVALIFDHFVEFNHYFLVEEHIRGKTLSEVFEEHGEPLKEAEVLLWAKTICDVLIYLHSEGVIHRDISPDNIMLTVDNTIKFIDFGTLRELREVAAGGTAGMGKFGFTPPEQWQGRPENRSDIFALGATVYFLLTGFLPLSEGYQSGQGSQREDFYPDFPPIREKNSAVSRQLERIIQKALNLEVENRYQSASDMWRELDDLLIPGSSLRQRVSIMKSRILNPRAYSIAATLLALCLIGTGVYYLASDKEMIEVWPEDSIQVAVDSANAGDTILVHAGVYNQSVIITKSNITLQAEDDVVLDGSDLNQGIGILVGDEIQHNKVADVIIEGFRISNFGSAGIYLAMGVQNITIQNNEISDSVRTGITSYGNDSHIIGNKITKFILTGISIGGINNEVLENIITDSYGENALGIDLKNYTSGTMVQNNDISHITGITGAGIVIGGTDNEILENKITEINGEGGVGITTTWETSTDNTIEGNVISLCDIAGIMINSASNNIKDNTITDIYGEHGSGIYLLALANGNTVENNQVTSTSKNGIVINGDSNKISNNTINHSNIFGIVTSTYDSDPTDNIIEKNYVRNSGHHDLYEGSAPLILNTWIDNDYTTKNWEE